MPPSPPVNLAGLIFSSLFHSIDVQTSIHRTWNCSYSSESSESRRGKTRILWKQTRKNTRPSRKRQKWRHGFFSDEKQISPRWSNARTRDLLASYIFIEDLPGNSSDYRLSVLWLPICSFFVFSHNLDMFSFAFRARLTFNSWIRSNGLVSKFSPRLRKSRQEKHF